MNKHIIYHENDIDHKVVTEHKSDIVAIDTEAMGLHNHRDRLCVIQLSFGDGIAHIVHLKSTKKVHSPNLLKILQNDDLLKIFHFARFDVAILQHYYGISLSNIYCTKIASRLVRTYSNHHGLKTLCDRLLNIKISKQEQSSYWGSDTLSDEQMEYAAQDVLYLHRLRHELNIMLKREERLQLAHDCFAFIPTRARLDVMGWTDDLLSH